MSVDNTTATDVSKIPIRSSPELPLSTSPTKTKGIRPKRAKITYRGAKFTVNQLAFIEFYCRGNSAREACLKAGYSQSTDPSSVLYRTDIWAEIEYRLNRYFENQSLTTERVLRGVQRCAEANILDYIEIQPDGTWRVNLNNITRDMGDAIQELYFDAAGRPRIRLVDKMAAKTLLARLKGMLNETQKIELTGKDGIPLNTIQAFDSIIMNTTINQINIESPDRQKLPESINSIETLASNHSRPVLEAHVQQ